MIDSSKRIIGDVRHRSIYHHTEGIWLCQRIFGRTITVAKDSNHPREVPVRLIAELHVEQDLGWIPSPKDYIDGMVLKTWMGGPSKKERNLEEIFPSGIRRPKTDPPPVPLIADPNLITNIISSGTKVPPPLPQRLCCCCGDWALENGYCGMSGCINRPA